MRRWRYTQLRKTTYIGIHSKIEQSPKDQIHTHKPANAILRSPTHTFFIDRQGVLYYII